MKATIEIPDDLYRLVKAKSSLEGRAVRDVTEELYRRWLAESPAPAPESRRESWLEDWIAMADKAMRKALPGPTARELLAKDRKRLERG
jgi:predicted CopG family antitoxin